MQKYSGRDATFFHTWLILFPSLCDRVLWIAKLENKKTSFYFFSLFFNVALWNKVNISLVPQVFLNSDLFNSGFEKIWLKIKFIFALSKVITELRPKIIPNCLKESTKVTLFKVYINCKIVENYCYFHTVFGFCLATLWHFFSTTWVLEIMQREICVYVIVQ